jgi:hypothetical protein
MNSDDGATRDGLGSSLIPEPDGLFQQPAVLGHAVLLEQSFDVLELAVPALVLVFPVGHPGKVTSAALPSLFSIAHLQSRQQLSGSPDSCRHRCAIRNIGAQSRRDTVGCGTPAGAPRDLTFAA